MNAFDARRPGRLLNACATKPDNEIRVASTDP